MTKHNQKSACAGPSFRRRQLSVRALVIASAVIPVTASTSRAVDRYYVGSSAGVWNAAGNWSTSPIGPGGATAPTAVGDAAIINTNYAVNVTLNVSPTITLLNVSGTGGTIAKVTHAGQSLTLSDQFLLGNAAGESGQYDLNGALTTMTFNGDSFTGPVQIGSSGTGSFALSNGLFTSVGNVNVGTHNGGVGTFTQNSGNTIVGRNNAAGGRSLFIGREAGAIGTYAMGGGTTDVYGSLQLGFAGSGTFNQTGGTVNVRNVAANTGLLFVGNATGATGQYTVSAGTVNVDSGVFIGGDTSGAGGTGVLTVSGGTFNSPGMTLWSSGTVNLNTGGTLDVGNATTDNVRCEGTINNNGGTLKLAGRIYTNNGTGVINNPSGNISLLDASNLQSGTYNISGGTVTGGAGSLLPGKLFIGLSTGSSTGNATVHMTGGTFNVGALGVGNDGNLASGTGTGTLDISGGTLSADTILLGSSAGGNGHMTISGTGAVVVGGGLAANSVTLTGGSLTVLDQNPPVGEDPVLDRAIVGGYLRDGAMNVNAGVVTTPKIKLGITSGKTGTFTQTSGVVNVGVFGVGNDANLTSGAGTGTATVSGGTLNADTILLGSTVGGTGSLTISGTGAVVVGGGINANSVTLTGGSLTVLDQNPPAIEDAVLDRSLVGGYLRDGAINVIGGVVTTPKLKLGISSGKTGSYTQAGGAVSVGILSAGNDANIASGAGTGHIAISGGTLYADTVLLGSTVGGSGDMTISGTAAVTVGGGLSSNTLNVTGGSLTVQDRSVLGNYPAGEDAVLHDAIVGGYLRDGAMNVSGGVVTSPKIKLGITSGKTGTYTQTSGTVNVDIFGVGNDGDPTSGSGTGLATVSGGTLNVTTLWLGSTLGGTGHMTINGTAQVFIGGLAGANSLTIDAGSLTVLDQDPPPWEPAVGNRSLLAGYLHDGSIFLNGGTVTTPNLKIGITANKTGTYTQTGGIANVGILGAGNDGALTSGAGTGQVTISGGTLNADTILLGSTVGGTGHMTISNTGAVVVGGGLNMNSLTMSGGSLTVLDQNPPAGEDAVLDRSIVGGYLRDGAMNVNAGTVTAPKIKLGVTSGKIGTYTQTGGTATVGTLGIGNDASLTAGSGVGHVTVSGGVLNATNILMGSTAGGTGDLTITGSGRVYLTGGINGQGTLSLSNGAVLLNGTTTKVRTLNMGGTPSAPDSKIDLNNGFLIVDYTPGNLGTQLADNTARVKAARAGALPITGIYQNTGMGITASVASSLNALLHYNKYVVGIINNADLAPGARYTTFGGLPVDDSSVLARFTYNGDANLDGAITGADYALIDAAYTAGTLNGGWLNGDFTLDGIVNADDYAILDFARLTWGGQTLDASVPISVPEPTGVLTLVLASAGWMRRRRRD